MESTEARLKSLATGLGAELVGITTVAVLADGPPSSDPRYLLPSANSVISFAISLDSDSVQDFISKREWHPHCENLKTIVQTLYTIGDKLTEQLISEGYEALNVDINNNYRPEKAAKDVTEMTEFHPDFSHRYGAIGAGIGRLGWSGNLLTREYGALVELGSVLTSAALRPDTPIPDEDHPCDRCKVCSLVCPVEMIQPKESTQVTIAGITETISRKLPNTCCWIGCTGYEGLSTSRTWSNWSPYRLGRSLPKEKHGLDDLCISLQKKDPRMQDVTNSLNNYRHVVFDSDWFYYTVCGFCRSACAPSRKERLSNHKMIINSGTAALKLDGSHVVADDNAVRVGTPFGLHVVIPCEELSKGRTKNPNRAGKYPLDREVIKHLYQHLRSADAKNPCR